MEGRSNGNGGPLEVARPRERRSLEQHAVLASRSCLIFEMDVMTTKKFLKDWLVTTWLLYPAATILSALFCVLWSVVEWILSKNGVYVVVVSDNLLEAELAIPVGSMIVSIILGAFLSYMCPMD